MTKPQRPTRCKPTPHHEIRGGFFLFSLLFLLAMPLASANWNQYGGNQYHTRQADGVLARDPSLFRTIFACSSSLPGRYPISEQLMATNPLSNNTVIIFLTKTGTSMLSDIVVNLYTLNMTGQHNCGAQNEPVSSSFFRSSSNTSMLFQSFGLTSAQPALIQRDGLLTMILPEYNIDQNLSISLVNLTAQDSWKFDTMIILNDSQNRTTGGSGSDIIGSSIAVQCLDSELCLVASANNGALMCGVNLTARSHACLNFTKGDWSSYVDLNTGSLGMPTKFVAWKDGVKVYSRMMVANTSGNADPYMIGYVWFTNTNAITRDTSFGISGLLQLDTGSQFPYAFTLALNKYTEDFLVPSKNITIEYAYSTICQSTSGSCGNGQDNTSYNAFGHILAWNGSTVFTMDPAYHCSPDVQNNSLSPTQYFPRIDSMSIIHTNSTNETFACMDVRSPDMSNTTFDGEVYTCNNELKQNAHGTVCYNITPDHEGGVFFSAQKSSSAWQWTAINTTLYNASTAGSMQGSTLPAYLFWLRVLGPRFSPSSLWPRDFLTWNGSTSGAWAPYMDDTTLARQNSTVWFHQLAQFQEPYSADNGFGFADWISSYSFVTCLNNTKQEFDATRDRAEWPVNPVTDEGISTRSYICDIDRWGRDYFSSKNSSYSTVATGYSSGGTLPAISMLEYIPSISSTIVMAVLDRPSNHTSVKIGTFSIDTGITDVCVGTNVTYSFTRGPLITNSSWYVRADCDGTGDNIQQGASSLGTVSNVSCVYGSTGTYRASFCPLDYFTVPTMCQNKTHAIPVNVNVVSGSCNNKGEGSFNFTSPENNTLPNFGTVIPPYGRTYNACFGQVLKFNVSHYYNPEANDLVRACFAIDGIRRTASGQTRFTNFSGLEKMTRCGDWAVNGTVLHVNATVAAQDFSLFVNDTLTSVSTGPGLWESHLYIQDNAHANVTSSSLPYAFNVRPVGIQADESCLLPETDSSNAALNTRTDWGETVKSFFASIGFSGIGSQLFALAFFMLVLAYVLFMFQAPPIAFAIVIIGIIFLAILTELIPFYFLIIPVVAAVLWILWNISTGGR